MTTDYLDPILHEIGQADLLFTIRDLIIGDIII